MKYLFSDQTRRLLDVSFHLPKKCIQNCHIVSLEDELPAEPFSPVEFLDPSFVKWLRNCTRAPYRESPPYAAIKNWLQVDWESRKGLAVSTNQIVLTTGTQQAIHTLLDLFVEEGTAVLVQNPTAPDILDALFIRKANIIGVYTHSKEDFIKTLKQRIEQYHPKLFFTMPSFSNPTGALWSKEDRIEVLDLCRRYHVLLIEHDGYSDLHFNFKDTQSFYKNYPSLYSLDQQYGGQNVVCIGSFDYTISPILNTGWMVCHTDLIQAMFQLTSFANMSIHRVSDWFVLHLLEQSAFNWNMHLATRNKQYLHHWQLVQQNFTNNGWKNTSFCPPSGGIYVWIGLPEGMDSVALFKATTRQGVSFLPGTRCLVHEQTRHYIRINFGHVNSSQLQHGLDVICEKMSEFTARS